MSSDNDFVMGTSVKIILTVAMLAIGVAVCFIDPKANNAGPDWFWSLGKHDPFRNLLCRPDGSLRRHAKPGMLLWFGLGLLILWMLP